MSDRGWKSDDVPSQTGKTFVVTGANSGLGLETARVLLSRGAEVVLACRDTAKGDRALADIGEQPGKGRVERLDLSSLASVRAFAERLSSQASRLDVLVNNAGLMAIPQTKTEDGFEMQVGTNHLGHFALTAALMPLLRRTAGARVVNVSSGVHHYGKLDIDDLFFEKAGYDEWAAYSRSKLCNLLFTLELDRRLKAANVDLRSLAAHPGYSATELQGKGAQMGGSKLQAGFMAIGNVLFAQSAAAGAWPQLRAATDPAAKGGDYFGPRGPFEGRGPAVLVKPSKLARDEALGKALFELSERLTGARFEL